MLVCVSSVIYTITKQAKMTSLDTRCKILLSLTGAFWFTNKPLRFKVNCFVKTSHVDFPLNLSLCCFACYRLTDTLAQNPFKPVSRQSASRASIFKWLLLLLLLGLRSLKDDHWDRRWTVRNFKLLFQRYMSIVSLKSQSHFKSKSNISCERSEILRFVLTCNFYCVNKEQWSTIWEQ